MRVENTSHTNNHAETLKMSNVQHSRQPCLGWKRVPYEQSLDLCNFNSVIGVELESHSGRGFRPRSKPDDGMIFCVMISTRYKRIHGFSFNLDLKDNIGRLL